MTFFQVVCYNIISLSINIFSSICVGIVFLKKMSPGRRHYGFREFFLLILYIVSTAAFAALLYKANLLKNPFINTLTTYLFVTGNALGIRLLFREKFQACWGVAIFSGIISDFALNVSLSLSAKEMFHLNIMRERIEYIFYTMIISPIIFILLLFLLHKIKVEETYNQWMEHRDIWRI